MTEETLKLRSCDQCGGPCGYRYKICFQCKQKDIIICPICKKWCKAQYKICYKCRTGAKDLPKYTDHLVPI